MARVACHREQSFGQSLIEGLREKLAGQSPVLLTVFSSPEHDLGKVHAGLIEAFPGAAVLGSTTSGEFTEAGDGKGSISVFALAGDFKVQGGMAEGLAANPGACVAKATEGFRESMEGYAHRTGIVLLDPLAGAGEEAALILAMSLGEAPLVGGAAGDDLAMTKTIVGYGTRTATDAVAVVSLFSKTALPVGICHGHAPLSKPLKATKVEGAVVVEIDGRPAWDVWKEQTAGRAKELGLDPAENPGAYLLRFEAGLQVGHEYKVRAPLAPKDDGGILFATPIGAGTVFTIMESDAEAQLESALSAASHAKRSLGERKIAGALVFDCICRKLILGDRYAEALTKISLELGGVPIGGFETYGEIAMNAGDMSGFHNTTTVVLAIPEDA